MQKDKLAILGVFCVIVLGAAGLAVLRGPARRDSPRGPSARSAPSRSVDFRGIALHLSHARDDHPYEQCIDEIAALGANAVCFVVHACQEEATSTSLFIDSRHSPSDHRVVQLISHAKARGLRTALMPMVLISNCSAGEWRGSIAPSNWADWWEDYRNFVLHYAYLAQTSRADLLFVGSQLVTAEGYKDRWESLIRQVRGAYKGLLSYSANWRHYRDIPWWSQLDMVGISARHDLTAGRPATIKPLLEAWKPLKDRILRWQAKVNKPILLSEVGCPGRAATNAGRSADRPDPQASQRDVPGGAQENYYEAFLRTWSSQGRQGLAGYFLWHWRNDPRRAPAANDAPFVLTGRPAAEVIRRHFSARSRPAGHRPATRLASRPARGGSLPADEAPPSQPAAAADPPMDKRQIRGISLQFHSADPKHPYRQYIDEIAATGANTLSLVVTAHQENASSSRLFVDARRTPRMNHMRELIAHAHRRSLRVVLMPIVLLENPRSGEWRGKILPEDKDQWWKDYRRYLLQYARLAEQSGVEILIVGSELVLIEDQTRRWRDLIASLRKAFRGKLSYSANWDHYRPIKWWDELDVIGMTTYYDLTGGDKPTVGVLMAAWRKIAAEILTWQRTIGKPILFTEVGWPNQATAAQYPWDYYRSMDKPDPQAQKNCFEAFFRTWAAEKVVAGYLVWEWRSGPSQAIGPTDTSYVPCGKPAMEVIKAYFKAPEPKRADSAPSRPGRATSAPPGVPSQPG